MRNSIADTVCSSNMKVNESPFVTVLLDESADITNNKHLVVYVQIIDPGSFQPITHFLAKKQCVDTTGAGIAKCVQEVTSELEIQLNKMVSMGSNGAEVMKGENKGCTGILLRFNTHMMNAPWPCEHLKQ